MTRAPIEIQCEGSGCYGHDVIDGVLCAMCGHIFPPEPDGSTPQHDRNDIIAMLKRGDFNRGAS